MAIFVGEWRRIGRVGTFGLWPCVLITRRSQVQILPPLLRERAFIVLAVIPPGKPGGISYVLTRFDAGPTAIAACPRCRRLLPKKSAARASAGVSAPPQQGAPHLHPLIFVLSSPLPPGAGVGSMGATGGAGPLELRSATTNPRPRGQLRLPCVAPPARPVSSRATHLPVRCRTTGYPSRRNPLPATAGMAGDCARAGAPDQSIPQAATRAAAERQHPMSTDDSVWVTRKEAAALARCSQDSIERTEKKHDLETRTSSVGATMLALDDLVRVGRVSADALTASKSGVECAELALAKEQLSALRSEVGRQGGRLAEREAFLDLLRQQVGEKDRQIKAQQTTIDRLTASLASRSAA
jgi:hypothetical protein